MLIRLSLLSSFHVSTPHIVASCSDFIVLVVQLVQLSTFFSCVVDYAYDFVVQLLLSWTQHLPACEQKNTYFAFLFGVIVDGRVSDEFFCSFFNNIFLSCLCMVRHVSRLRGRVSSFISNLLVVSEVVAHWFWLCAMLGHCLWLV